MPLIYPKCIDSTFQPLSLPLQYFLNVDLLKFTINLHDNFELF